MPGGGGILDGGGPGGGSLPGGGAPGGGGMLSGGAPGGSPLGGGASGGVGILGGGIPGDISISGLGSEDGLGTSLLSVAETGGRFSCINGGGLLDSALAGGPSSMGWLACSDGAASLIIGGG